MVITLGFEDEEKVCRIHSSLYRVFTAGRALRKQETFRLSSDNFYLCF